MFKVKQQKSWRSEEGTTDRVIFWRSRDIRIFKTTVTNQNLGSKDHNKSDDRVRKR